MKWQGHLHPLYKLEWLELWHGDKVFLKIAFLWSLWHMAITINHWKAHINPTLDLIVHFVFHVFKKQNIIDFMIVLKYKMSQP